MGKPNSRKMRVYRIENLNKSLALLQKKMRLKKIGAEHIVDGIPRMILGLIWTIILRFQIQVSVEQKKKSFYLYFKSIFIVLHDVNIQEI